MENSYEFLVAVTSIDNHVLDNLMPHGIFMEQFLLI